MAFLSCEGLKYDKYVLLNCSKKRKLSCRCEGGVREKIKVMKSGRGDWSGVEGKCKCGKEVGGAELEECEGRSEVEVCEER